MRKYLLLVVIALSFGLGSCQCSSPPPIGLVESDEALQAPDTTGPAASER